MPLFAPSLRDGVMSRPSSIAVGQVFARLTVEGPPERRAYHIYWPCRCVCGGRTVSRGTTLTNGEAQSCGCLMRERQLAATVTHGHTDKAHNKRSPEYYTWIAIKARCERPTVVGYSNYGGRGIAVCDRWRDSFPNFLADMGPRPSPKHSIDRIDVNGPYEPANCRWATQSEQCNNKRHNQRRTHNGQTMTLSQWSVKTGIHRATLEGRLRRGWSVQAALEKPARRCHHVTSEASA